MRLIDADSINWESVEEEHGARTPAVVACQSLVQNAPTIEAEPVRHGEWEVAGNTTHYYTCSVCGKPGDGFDNYCRSCGALMERPCDNERAYLINKRSGDNVSKRIL